MGSWYWIGVAAGLGVAWGAVFAGLASSRPAVIVGGVAAALLAFAGAYLLGGYLDGVVAAAVAVVADAAGSIVVGGARRRGGTRWGTALIVTGAALVVAALAFVPALGFFEAVALPVLAARLLRKQPERYAGLRTLAKD